VPQLLPVLCISSTGNRNAVSYTQANKAQILGWQGHVQEPGRYRLHIRSCCPWVLEPLQYEFEVCRHLML